ncbi:MAG: type II secretion system F family protein [Patescibacteria group bacterium]|nr:type II secretion system F family protein [Patescibacteria group bacterium]
MNKKPIIFKISLNEKILFLRNLALLLKSGLSLTDSLISLKNYQRSSTLKYILNRVIDDIQRGQFLAHSLMNFRNLFGDFLISIIKVGEITGNLVENLERLSDELKKIEKLKRKFITTMIYPAFIISVMIAIIIFIIYFIFPKLLPIFENLNIELPLTTKIFLIISKFLINYSLYIAFLIFSLGVLLIFSLRFPHIKYFFDLFILKIPLISGIVKKYNLAQFCRSLALLLKSGIKIVEAIEIAGRSLTNEVYKKNFIASANFVLAGHSFNEFLEKNQLIFPYNFVKMIEVGEKTGNLEQNLFYLSANYEEELDAEIERFVNALEPVILIIMAIVVGFMAISIITPIYELSDKMQK